MSSFCGEIADEKLGGGYPWQIRFSHGREELGICETYAAAITDVEMALRRERQAREIGAYYESRKGRDSGD